MRKVYVASKSKFGDMWQKLANALAYPEIRHTTWILEWQPGASPSLKDLWTRCIREASTADAVVLYDPLADDVLKGALVELGAALAHNVPVYYTGHRRPDTSSFLHHPCVIMCRTLDDALDLACGRVAQP